ncbi:MAG: hypothetical protein HYZ75_09380 [Elusimicrobia bacterium]|nr:hypothetical protein [Elusimicrobiota bacterium]
MTGVGPRTALFLAAAAFLAYGGPLIAELGFYHDDWWFLSVMRFAPDGFAARLAALLKDSPSLHFRPLDAPLLAGLYTTFGLAPLGWQAAALAANLAAAWAGALVLAEYGAGPRAAALGAVFALSYPNKDAALFWPMTVIIPTSWALFLFATLAHLDWVKRGRRASLGASALLLLLSLSFYDQSLFQFLAWTVLPEAAEGEARRRSRAGLAAAAGAAALVLFYRFFVVRQVFGVEYNKQLLLSPVNALLVGLRALETSFGWRIVKGALLGARDGLAAAPLTALAAAALPWGAWKLLPEGPEAAGARARRLALFGAALFVLGYLPIALSDYRPTPLTHMNRINLVPVGGLALAGAALAMAGARRRRWALAGTAACSLFMAAHVGFAGYWAESARIQASARALLLSNLGLAPPDATLLIGWPGFYVGQRAPLLLASWDATGAVRVWTGDRSREADVLRPDVVFVPEGVSISGRVLPYPSVRVLDVEKAMVLTVSP